eukprot:3618078-Rhodomonas_salina.7
MSGTGSIPAMVLCRRYGEGIVVYDASSKSAGTSYPYALCTSYAISGTKIKHSSISLCPRNAMSGFNLA